MNKYKFSIVLYLLSGLVIVAAAYMKIMHVSFNTAPLFVVGLVAQFVAIGSIVYFVLQGKKEVSS